MVGEPAADEARWGHRVRRLDTTRRGGGDRTFFFFFWCGGEFPPTMAANPSPLGRPNAGAWNPGECTRGVVVRPMTACAHEQAAAVSRRTGQFDMVSPTPPPQQASHCRVGWSEIGQVLRDRRTYLATAPRTEKVFRGAGRISRWGRTRSWAHNSAAFGRRGRAQVPRVQDFRGHAAWRSCERSLSTRRR